MKKFTRIVSRMNQFGGVRLIRGYSKLGVLSKVLRVVFPGILFKPYNSINGDVLRTIAPAIREQYAKSLAEIESRQKMNSDPTTKKSNIIWVCWLQGIEKAPKLVQVCYRSIQKHLQDRVVILLTEENIGQYVSLPDFIENRYREGIIPTAHYTDLLRLELLIKYGGTWIDSTVLCTGDDYPKEILDSELFVFQHLEKSEYAFRGLSNWFITSCADNWVLKELRDLLYQYWKDYDCVVHYYMFHLFFGMIMEKHPEVAAKMPKYGNRVPHYLSRRMGDKYDKAWMQELKAHSCFHKLSYRLDDKVLESNGTFYDEIINKNIYGIK